MLILSLEEAGNAQRRQQQHTDDDGAQGNDVEKRAARARNFVQLGELSSPRQALAMTKH